MPKSLCLSAFHDIEMPIKYEIPRNEKSKIQNKKLKNSDERSVRVPNRVKRGVYPCKTRHEHAKNKPHYKYNVTHRQNTHQKRPHTPPKTRLKCFIYRTLHNSNNRKQNAFQTYKNHMQRNTSAKQIKRFNHAIFAVLDNSKATTKQTTTQ